MVAQHSREAIPPTVRRACIFSVRCIRKDSRRQDFTSSGLPEHLAAGLSYPEYFGSEGLYVSDTIQIWDPQNGFVLPSEYAPDTSVQTSEIQNYLTNADLYNFSVYPFYGYDGWDRDVISCFKKIPFEKLSDDELYGTGRAFSQAASGLMRSHSRGTGPDTWPSRTTGKNRAQVYSLCRKKHQLFRQFVYKKPVFSDRCRIGRSEILQ